MKITGPGPISPTPSRPSRLSRDGKGTAFSQEIPEETSAAAPSMTGSPVGGIEGILSVQEVPDATQGRSRGLARANDVLERLDEIRHDLLLGAIPKGRLVALRQQVHEMRSSGNTLRDPRLSAILEEIDLRASVELAKLGITR